MHPNDEFHPPTNDDPYWSETNWFAFGVPDRKLSGWLYPFFRPNLGVCSAAVLLWDDQGDQTWNCRYSKQFWHLPMPDGPLSDFTLANGLSYRCTEDEMVYQLTYHDPDAGDDEPEISIALTFSAIMFGVGTARCQPTLECATRVVEVARERLRSFGPRGRRRRRVVRHGARQ